MDGVKLLPIIKHVIIIPLHGDFRWDLFALQEEASRLHPRIFATLQHREDAHTYLASILPSLNSSLNAVARKEALSNLTVVLVGNAPKSPVLRFIILPQPLKRHGGFGLIVLVDALPCVQVETLLYFPNSLITNLAALIQEGEIFLDTNPKYFIVLINFFRYKMFDSSLYSIEEINDIKNEAEYFELPEFLGVFTSVINEITYNKVTENKPFKVGKKKLASHKVTDLKTNNGLGGYCVQKGGYITVFLKEVSEISKIDIRGYVGSNWNSSSGEYGQIEVKSDENNGAPKVIGSIPAGFGDTIVSIEFETLKCKSIIFKATNTELGIGYLKIFS